MLTSLDHVRVRALDVAKSADDYEALLGAGSRDDRARLHAGTTGLELVDAGDRDAASEGVDALVFATDSLDLLAGQLRARGVEAARISGDPDRLVLDAAATRGMALEVIEAPVRAVQVPSASDVAERLDHAVVLTHAHEKAIALYRDALGLRLALDRSFAQRGVRILFFRLGGVTIEVAGPMAASADDAADDAAELDHFGGLAWRGRDLVAWRDRLVGAGFQVSEHRKGHKPGTRVCTVGDRSAGVPTLLIGEDAASSSI